MVWWREDPWFQWKNLRINEKIVKLGICHHYATVCLRFDSVPQMFAVRSISRKGNSDVQFQAGIDVFPRWCGSLLLWRQWLQHKKCAVYFGDLGFKCILYFPCAWVASIESLWIDANLLFFMPGWIHKHMTQQSTCLPKERTSCGGQLGKWWGAP
jgi:hypothetical protein